jgi:putative transposase
VKTYVYPFHPTKAQEAVLHEWLYLCQQLYNAAFEHRREAYRKQHKTVSFYEQKRELKDIRRADARYVAVPHHVLANPLLCLDLAYKAFFRRVKQGDRGGYPKFKRLDQYNTITLTFDHGRSQIVGEGRSARIHVPKLGLVKFNKYRAYTGKPKQFNVTRLSTGKWQLALVCETDVVPKKMLRPDTRVLGIDLGHGDDNLVVTTDPNIRVTNERFFKRSQNLLATRQQRLSRKQRGSNTRQRAKELVAKTHAHVKNQRREHARNVAKLLFTDHDVVVYEELNIKGLAQGRFSKSVNDAAWGQIIRCIQLKADDLGKRAVGVDPRGTSQRCSSCGHVPTVKKTLADRSHACGACGFTVDRDVNAALNIKALGLSVVRSLAEAQNCVKSYWYSEGPPCESGLTLVGCLSHEADDDDG